MPLNDIVWIAPGQWRSGEEVHEVPCVVKCSTGPAPGTPGPGAAAWREALAGSPGRRPLPNLGGATLLLLDLQRIFIDPASPAFLPAWPAVAPRCRALRDAFRGAGRPVVHSLHRNPPGDAAGVIAHFGGRPLRPTDPLAGLHPSWGAAPGEALIEKARYSAWLGTILEELVPPGSTLVLAGVTTHRCVLAAAVEAASRDRLPVVVADACCTRGSELQLATLRCVAHGFGYVASVDEVLRVL
jgi:nicotinamidase-related amidase